VGSGCSVGPRLLYLLAPFKGKPELAPAAIRRTAEELPATAEGVLDGPGTPYERIEACLRRERDVVLRGCPVGRLAMDPDVIAGAELREPVDATLDAILERLAGIVEEGKEQGQFRPDLDGEEIAATILATLQGGHVLARASGVTGRLRRRHSGAALPPLPCELPLLRGHLTHAMQYELTLLDEWDGLGVKAYLLREHGVHGSPVNQYAPFYLWNTVEGMNRFLWGGASGFPAAVAVRRRQRMPEDGELAAVMEEAVGGTRQLAGEDGAVFAAVAVDPYSWELVHFSLWELDTPKAEGTCSRCRIFRRRGGARCREVGSGDPFSTEPVSEG
jgi:hypothetical protein